MFVFYKKFIFLSFCYFFCCFFSVEAKENINVLVAQAILEDLDEEQPKYVTSFYQGLEDSQRSECQPLNDLDNTKLWKELMTTKTKLAKKKNLRLFNSFIEKLNMKHVVCIHPKCLYYKTLSVGEGKLAIQSKKDVIQCTIQISSLEGKLFYSNVADTMVKVFHLDDLLPGICIGLQRMREGEEREIYIHPSFAYGSFSQKEPNMGFIVVVRLLKVLERNKPGNEIFHPLIIEEVQESEEGLSKQIDNLEEAIAYDRGIRLGKHLSASKKIEIKKILENMKKGHFINCSTKNIQKTLNTLHWEIYNTEFNRGLCQE